MCVCSYVCVCVLFYFIYLYSYFCVFLLSSSCSSPALLPSPALSHAAFDFHTSLTFFMLDTCFQSNTETQWSFFLVADLSAEFYRCVCNSEVLSIKKKTDQGLEVAKLNELIQCQPLFRCRSVSVHVATIDFQRLGDQSAPSARKTKTHCNAIFQAVQGAQCSISFSVLAKGPVYARKPVLIPRIFARALGRVSIFCFSQNRQPQTRDQRPKKALVPVFGPNTQSPKKFTDHERT